MEEMIRPVGRCDPKSQSQGRAEFPDRWCSAGQPNQANDCHCTPRWAFAQKLTRRRRDMLEGTEFRCDVFAPVKGSRPFVRISIAS